MPALALLDVVFLGMVGADPGHVGTQLAAVDGRVHAMKIPAADAATLVHHGENAREIVEKLGVDGAYVAEVVADHGSYTLRVMVYAADGGVRSMTEIPLAGKALTKDELDVVKGNLGDELAGLIRIAAKKAPPKVEPKPAKVEPKPAKVVEPKPVKVEPKVVEPEIELDPSPPAAPAPVASADDGDSVSADEIAAFSASAKAEPAAKSAAPELHLDASAGLAVVSRSFAPGTASVIGYSSAPVGAARVDAHVEPARHLVLGLALEQSLGMTTSLGDGDAPTDMSRWEVTAAYAIGGDRIQLAPTLGYGHRAFSITSQDAARSPDGTYQYLVIGATAAMHVGSRVRVVGNVAFEPVTSGLEPSEMSLGDARRWAIDMGIAVEARATEHVFVRAALDYQRFQWAWEMASGSDSYPSGAVALGLHY